MPPGSFQCAFCGKSFRWKPQIAGRSARCKCGKTIHIPETAPAPGSNPELSEGGDTSGGGGGSALGAALDGLDAPSPPSSAARTAFCKACRRPMKPGAVLCLECGLNQQTGEALHAEVQTLTAKDRRKAKWDSGMAGLQFVRAGLWCNFAGLVLYYTLVIGSVVLAQAEIALPPVAVLLLALTTLLAVFLMLISPVLCLMVPKDSGARGMLWTSLACFVGSFAIGVAGQFMPVPVLLGIAGPFGTLVGTLFLLMFLLKLAEYLDVGQVVDDAEKLMKAFIGLILCGLLVLVPCLGCLALIPFVVLFLYVLIAYALLNHNLARVIGVTLREGFD